MATSGVVGAATLDLASILEHAMRRCKLTESEQTPEIVEQALGNLQMLINELSNLEVNLWCIEKIIVGLFEHKESYPLPAGTVDVLNVYLRDSPRADGVLSSSDGQSVGALEDGDVTTFLTQLSTGGNFRLTFDDDDVTVRTVGFIHKGNTVRTLVFEVSQDNVTWATVRALASATYEEGVWYWFDMDPAKPGLHFRMRDAATNAPLSAYEFYASTEGREITMARLNRDDFTSLPDKFQRGRPLQFWFDRQLTNAVIHTWPSPDDIYQQMVIWRHRLVQDVGTDLTLELEVPQKWRNVVVSGLAVRLAKEVSKVDPALIPMLKEDYKEALALAGSDEVDNSVMVLRPSLRPYTR